MTVAVMPSVAYQDDLVTLYHGDARALLADLSFDAIVSDPPYGIRYRSNQASDPVLNAEMLGDDTDYAAWLIERTDCPAAVFASPKMARPRRDDFRSTLVWSKGNHVGAGDLSYCWRPNYELIHIYGRGWTGRRTSSVLSHNAIAFGRNIHPTEKPLGLMVELLAKTPDHWVICDPFAGSGTTLLAARQLGRTALGVELDPHHVQTATRRLGVSSDSHAQQHPAASGFPYTGAEA